MGNSRGEPQDYNGPRIIIIAREPIDRAWSSYNYNYVQPALTHLKKRWRTSHNQSNEMLISLNVFSFEEMVEKG